MIVLDASAALELLLRSPAAPLIERRIFDPAESVHAPHLIDIEVAQVVRRYVRRGELGTCRGTEVLADLTALPIERYPHDVFLSRIFGLRENLTAYDAAYVALAEALPAPLLTCDAKLAEVPGSRAVFELIGRGTGRGSD